MMLSGFKAKFMPRLTKEEHEWALEHGIPINKHGIFHIYSSPSYLRDLIDFPFPFLLADSLVIDDLALKDSMWTTRDTMDALAAEFLAAQSDDPTHYSRKVNETENERLRALCLKRLYEEKGNDQVFETYSAQGLIEDKKEEFQEELFNTVLDRGFGRFAQNKTAEMVNRGVFRYDEMVVPPWLFESFRTVISIFSQKEISSGELLPVYDIDHFKDFYVEALAATSHSRLTRHYPDEEPWTDFVEILPIVAEKLEITPLSDVYTTPESLANRIIELRGDSDLRDARRKLFKVFLNLKSGIPLREVIEDFAEELRSALKKKRKIRFRMLLKEFLGGVIIGGHFGKIVLGLKSPGPVDFTISLLAIPHITYALTESLERDYERLQSFCWTGFFEKLG